MKADFEAKIAKCVEEYKAQIDSVIELTGKPREEVEAIALEAHKEEIDNRRIQANALGHNAAVKEWGMNPWVMAQHKMVEYLEARMK